MRQTESPKSQIGSSVGDTTQAVLYSVDGLVHGHVWKVKLWDRDIEMWLHVSMDI